MKKFQIQGDDISDGYHTFGELYEHRCLLFLSLCLLHPKQCTWKKDFETWFCLYWESPEGQISYHLPDKFLPYVESVIRQDAEYKWDGHTSSEVANRLLKVAKALQPSLAPRCPWCGSIEIAVERRPNGRAKCCKCERSWVNAEKDYPVFGA